MTIMIREKIVQELNFQWTAHESCERQQSCHMTRVSIIQVTSVTSISFSIIPKKDLLYGNHLGASAMKKRKE